MKIAITFLFMLNSTIVWGKPLTYKGIIGNIGVFKDNKCRSIFVKLNHNVPNTTAYFMEHTKYGAILTYVSEVDAKHLEREIIPFDKVCGNGKL